MRQVRLLGTLLLALFASQALAASYEWRDVVQQVTIQADGSVLVSDERTLWTDEDFGEAFICINHLPSQRVTLLPGSGALGPGPSSSAFQQGCAEGAPGTELVVKNSSRVRERRVLFNYRLDNTLDYYFDVVQWAWIILEEDRDSPPVRGYQLTVDTPGPMAQPYDAIVYRFGNREEPTVTLSEDRSHLSVHFNAIPAGSGVEIKYLMDPRLFTHKSSEPGLEALLLDATAQAGIGVPGAPAITLDSSPGTVVNSIADITITGQVRGTSDITQVRIGLNGGASAECQGTAEFSCTVTDLPEEENRLQVIAFDADGRSAIAQTFVRRLTAFETQRSNPWLALIGVALFGWVLSGLLNARRTHHDPKLPTMLYPFEPPSDLPAAAVPALLSKTFSPSSMNPAFSATVMDLARRGYGTFTGQKNRFSMDVNMTRSTEGLLGFELSVLDFLRNAAAGGQRGALPGFLRQVLGQPAAAVPAGDVLPLDEAALKKYGRTQTGFIEKWATGVRKWVLAQFGGRLLTADSVRAAWRWAGFVALAVVGQVALTAATLGTARVAFLLLAVLTALLFIMVASLPSWKTDVAEQVYGWQGFRRTLSDYTQMKDAPDDFFMLWDKYFVYAAALGVAKQFLKNLERAAPLRGMDETAMMSRAAWIGSYSAMGGLGSLSEFTGAVSAMSSSLSASLASAGVSASSGGSSSGGGGGGGGGSSGGR